MSDTQSMKSLMTQIQEVTAKQKSQNKGDEVAVAQALLNDPEFQELAAKSMADGVLRFFNVPPEPQKVAYKKKSPARQAVKQPVRASNKR